MHAYSHVSLSRTLSLSHTHTLSLSHIHILSLFALFLGGPIGRASWTPRPSRPTRCSERSSSPPSTPSGERRGRRKLVGCMREGESMWMDGGRRKREKRVEGGSTLVFALPQPSTLIPPSPIIFLSLFAGTPSCSTRLSGRATLSWWSGPRAPVSRDLEVGVQPCCRGSGIYCSVPLQELRLLSVISCLLVSWEGLMSACMLLSSHAPTPLPHLPVQASPS